MRVGLIGGGFQHAYSTTLWKRPSYFEFAKGEVLDCTFWIDDAISRGISSNCSNKYAWLVESNDVIPNAVQFIKENFKLVSESFRYLFTHNKEILPLSSKFRYVAPHATWITEPRLYTKTKLASLISSNKAFTAGHQHRLGLIEKFKDKVDLFGRGFKEVEKKEEALADYYFSICMENSENYYSEKVLDCFACGTVPIYFGDWEALAQDGYDIRGLLKLDENFSLNDLTIERYESMLLYIKHNLERVKRWNTVEDQLWEEYLK